MKKNIQQQQWNYNQLADGLLFLLCAVLCYVCFACPLRCSSTVKVESGAIFKLGFICLPFQIHFFFACVLHSESINVCLTYIYRLTMTDHCLRSLMICWFLNTDGSFFICLRNLQLHSLWVWNFLFIFYSIFEGLIFCQSYLFYESLSILFYQWL